MRVHWTSDEPVGASLTYSDGWAIAAASMPGALVSHPDLYLILLAAEDAVVRDGDPVGVVRQVAQHPSRPTRGGLV